jgi:hypothetical protein
MMRNKLAFYLAVIGGICLIIGGGVGMAPLLMEIQPVVEENISDDERISNTFRILILLASLGGIAVILGGVLIYMEFIFAAKILIALGAGIGIFGLLIGLGLAWYAGEMDAYFNGILTTIAGVGVLLAVAASFVAK